MEILQSFLESLKSFISTGIAIAGSIIVLIAARYIIEKQSKDMAGRQFRRQIVTLILSFAALLAIILALPLSENTRGQLLSLIGILLSAAIALSSTTFVGNAMAGMMLRAVRSFRPGDFIRVGDYFGRVTERGLFHIEIQTEDRDLTTMPNLYLVTNPVKVIRSSGTIITAEVSLGYDTPRTKIEKLLIEAALASELKDPFVHVMNLGDFSVTYRVAGMLTEVKQLISARSGLRQMMLDKLHQGGVEIISPTFMNTRAFPETRSFIPRAEYKPGETEPATEKRSAEEIAFDKADEAESIEKLHERFGTLGKEIDKLKERIKETEDESKKDELRLQEEWLNTRRERIAEIIKRKEEE